MHVDQSPIYLLLLQGLQVNRLFLEGSSEQLDATVAISLTFVRD